MNNPQHIPHRQSCPFLPKIVTPIRASHTRPIRKNGDPRAYYEITLLCAQSLWLQGKPAQALLQLNHTLSIETHSNTTDWMLPYQAKQWLFIHRQPEEFIGNPVRHYQHLATRVSGKMKELRSWRAWACFHLAEDSLPPSEYPRDHRQITQESLTIPSKKIVLSRIQHLGIDGEAQHLQALFTLSP